MKMKPFHLTGSRPRLTLALFVMALFLLIPNGGVLADANVPTASKTPEPTDTPTTKPPTQEPTAAATNTPIQIPTESTYPQPAVADNIPQPVQNGSGLSTVDRVLLMLLAIAVVIVVGVLVYIFMLRARGGSG